MKKLYIEIADTPYRRSKGLMGRKKLGKNCGMLFKFPYKENLSFWMANTYIPLDIAFIDDNGKILQIESMVPLSTKPVCSHVPCRFAIEVGSGWFAKNNVKNGCYVKGHGFDIFKSAQNIEEQVEQEEQAPPVSMNVQLNMSFEDQIERANLRKNDLYIVYETKAGNILPPKVISPPFSFESDEDGKSNAIVKAWDNQTAGWKSFILDNIITMEEKK